MKVFPSYMIHAKQSERESLCKIFYANMALSLSMMSSVINRLAAALIGSFLVNRLVGAPNSFPVSLSSIS